MQATACPDDAALRDLIAGKIDEISENSLALHIQDCDHCRQRAQQIEQQRSDSILQMLQAKDGNSAYYGEPDCRWSTARALGVIAGGTPDETQADQFELPLELGDNRILEAIVHGGMGVVYRAQHLRLGRDVAVKIVSGRRLADRRAVQRFEAEMRTLGQLSHPNIVSALDARELAGQPVLEYVDGMDLSKIAERLGPLPADIVAAIGAAVATALDYANRNGLIHRDVKPSNVMINSSGQIKLLDLGLARLQASSSGDTTGTLAGLALGTADYMSPEQIHEARGVDPRADLYSLGCTLYKLLTGEAPYSGPRYATNFAKLQGHVSDDPICVPPKYRNGAEQLVELIQQLTAKQRDNRPESAAQVSQQLGVLGKGANLAQLVSLAQKAPDLSINPTPSEAALLPAQRPSSSRRSGIPPWLRWTIAASSFPAGIALGIWLTVKKPDGTQAKIQVPSGSAANIDPQGNVELNLSDLSNPSASRLAPTFSDPPMGGIPDTSHPSVGSNYGAEATKVWSQTTQQSEKNQPFQTNSKNEGGMDDQELASLMRNLQGTEATYRSYTYEQWLALMSRERDVDTAIIAAKALIALAQSPEQQREVAQEILQKSRVWGKEALTGLAGLNNQSLSPTDKWLVMFLDETFKLDVAVRLEAIAEELGQANQQSYFACYQLIAGIIDRGNYFFFSDAGDFEPIVDVSDLRHDIVSQLLSSLEAANAKLTVGEPWKVGFNRYAARLAGATRIPYSETPQSFQERLKRNWESLASTPLDQIHRKNYPFNSPLNNPDFESPWLPTAWEWRPYWSSLPADQRQPVLVLHQIFQDQVLQEPELNLQETLAALTVVSDDEKQKIKLLLAQRLADSDFDNPQDSGRIIWPEILKWCVQRGVIDNDTAKQTLRIVNETSSSIAKLVGGTEDVLALSRRGTGLRMEGGMSDMSSGSSFGAEAESKNAEAINKLLEQATLRLADLLELPADVRQFTYRLPGTTPNHERSKSHGADGTGIGISGRGE